MYYVNIFQMFDVHLQFYGPNISFLVLLEWCYSRIWLFLVLSNVVEVKGTFSKILHFLKLAKLKIFPYLITSYINLWKQSRPNIKYKLYIHYIDFSLDKAQKKKKTKNQKTPQNKQDFLTSLILDIDIKSLYFISSPNVKRN